MRKKVIILTILISLLIAGGILWWQSEKTEKVNLSDSVGESLEERIKAESPEIAKRLEEEEKGKNEKQATSLAELNTFGVSEKCFNGGFMSCRNGVCQLEDGTVCSKAVEIRGTKNQKTDTFRLENDKEGISFDFYIILNKFPSEKKNPAYKISLYKVGEKEPISTHSDIITLKRLKELGWTPEQKFGSEPAGIAGGIAGTIIENPGPGEFYFEIEVENVDSWFLKVEKGVISRG